MKSRGLADVWLGGNDLEEEAAWKWTDCAAWEVEFWITKWGQPNGGTNANCLAFQWERNSDTVGWNDYICHQNQAPFVCSKKICTGEHYQVASGSADTEGMNSDVPLHGDNIQVSLKWFGESRSATLMTSLTRPYILKGSYFSNRKLIWDFPQQNWAENAELSSRQIISYVRSSLR